MNRQDLLRSLVSTLADRRVSHGERTALKALLSDANLSNSDATALRSDLFAAVLARVRHPDDRDLVEWLGDAVSLLGSGTEDQGRAPSSRALFGPEDPMVETLVTLISAARRTIDVAVFTVTDDRLTEAMVAAHDRGVVVRVLSDDDKSGDRGSDIRRLAKRGLGVAVDESPHHFHHKFAIFDGRRLVNGSYNWTRSADRHNRENYLITDDAPLVAAYTAEFDRLWTSLRGPQS